MNKCQYCGFPMRDNVQFCPKCGAPQPDEEFQQQIAPQPIINVHVSYPQQSNYDPNFQNNNSAINQQVKTEAEKFEKKEKTGCLTIGLWILFFPIMLWIYAIKKKRPIWYIIAVVVTLFCLIAYLGSPKNEPIKNRSVSLISEQSFDNSISEITNADYQNNDINNTVSINTESFVSRDKIDPSNLPVTNEKRPTLQFVLMDELGEYGEEVTLNAGTEFEEIEITHHIPAGSYLVTNLDKKRSAQVTVYSGGPEYEGEWQYFIADESCARPIVVMPYETKELEIKEGQFVVLSDGSENIQFVLK